VPFETPRGLDALHGLVINHQRSADGVLMAVSFIMIHEAPYTLREIPVDGRSRKECDLIARTVDTDVPGRLKPVLRPFHPLRVPQRGMRTGAKGRLTAHG
jgi:hypothetical protein